MINIYLITNTINTKKYVGQTTKLIEERFKKHCDINNAKRMLISRAIKKYGKEHFKIELIVTVKTLEQANKQEVHWAKHYNCFSPYGYNLKAGGRKYIHFSKEIRAKISASNLGKKASAETLKKLSESHKGIKVSEETKKKLSSHFKGKKPHTNTALGASLKNAKPTKWLNPQKQIIIVDNMRQFFKGILSLTSVHKMIKRKDYSIKGWCFVEYLNKQ